jgi:hypothetical protein
MADYIKRVCRFFALVALAWPVLGFLGVWQVMALQAAAFLGVLAMPCLVFGGAIVWMFRGPDAPVPGRWLAIALPAALAILLLAAAVPLLEAGCYVGNVAKLAVNRARYDAIVASPRPTKAAPTFDGRGGAGYVTEPGPPVRIVFASGIRESISPWGTILYDPSDEAARAGFDRSGNPIGALNAATRYLTPITGCWHLSGHYYTCWFDWG